MSGGSVPFPVALGKRVSLFLRKVCNLTIIIIIIIIPLLLVMGYIYIYTYQMSDECEHAMLGIWEAPTALPSRMGLAVSIAALVQVGEARENRARAAKVAR